MKKITAFLIALTLVLGFLQSFAEENARLVEKEEIISASYELLTALGTTPKFSGDASPVSRGAFIEEIISVLNLNTELNNETCFYDVSANDSFNSAVNYALDMGIISAGKYFRPNDTILYSEACKIILSALGYTARAEGAGGFPSGYLTVASQLRLDKGISVSQSGELNGAQCSILIANMLKADMMVMDSVVTHRDDLLPVYNTVSNFLYILYGWTEFDGIVCGNEITNIYDKNEKCAKGYVFIGDNQYKTDLALTLGLRVRGYAKDENGTNVIKYVTFDESSILTVYSGENILLKNNSLSYYRLDEKENYADIDTNCSVLYNGKVCSGLTGSDFDIEIGKIVLVDSDLDFDYDVVHIYSGEIAVADVSNSENWRVVDSFRNKVFNFQDGKIKYRVFSSGTETLPKAITQGTVFEYYTSKDGSYTEIHIISNVVSGKIKEKTGNSIVIDEKEYFTTDYFENRFAVNADIGIENSFVLTECGKLASIVTGNTPEGKLGYAYRYMFGEGISKRLTVLILTQDGDHVVYEVADKVIINGSQMITYNEFAGYLERLGETILRYKTDGEDRISSVYFPQEPSETTAESVYDQNADGKETLKPYVIEGVSDTTLITYKIFGIFIPHFIISNSTVVFHIDPSSSEDKDKYTIGSLNTLNNDASVQKGDLQAYNVNSLGKADVLVLRHATAESMVISRDLLGGVIESISDYYDVTTGETSLKIVVGTSVYSNSTAVYTTIYVPKSDENYAKAKSELDYGDFIVFSTDKYNNLLNYEKCFDYSSGKVLHASGGDNDGLSFYYGKLDLADSGAFSVDIIDASTPTKSSRTCFVVRSDTNLTWLANTKNKTVSGLAYAQLSSYMKQGVNVLVRTYCAEPFQIVVYNK